MHIIAFCFCFFLIHFLFGEITYETDDDTTMNFIAVGVFGEQYRAYFIFSNIIYGEIIKLLYTVMPNINSYLGLMMVLNFFSISSVTLMIGFRIADQMDKDLNWIDILSISSITSVIVDSFLAHDFYQSLQFTKNAGLYTIVGISILYVWKKKKCDLKNFIWIWGILFFILGFMVRTKSFLAVLLVCCFILIGFLVVNVKKWLRKDIDYFQVIKQNNHLIVVICIALFCILLLYIINNIAYSSNEWKEYKEFSKYRSALIDYNIPDYSDNEETYKEINWTELDVDLFRKWVFADESKYNTSNFKKILDSRDNSQYNFRIDLTIAIKAFTEFKNLLFNHNICFFWIILLLSTLLTRDYKKMYIFIISTAGIFFELYFLLCKGRINWRSEMLPWLTIVIFLSVCFLYNHKIHFKKNNYHSVLSTIIILIFLQTIYSSNNISNYNIGSFFDKKQTVCNTYKELNARNENMYIFTVSCPESDNIVDINRSYKSYLSNITAAGGWSVFSPLRDGSLHLYEIDHNVLQSLITHNNVYLVDNSDRYLLIKTYLDESTGIDVICNKIDEINGLNIYKYSYQ